MKIRPLITSALALLLYASTATAQQGDPAMDHSQHMMQNAPAADAQQAPGTAARKGKGGMGSMGGKDGKGKDMGCGMMGDKAGGGMGGGMGGMGGGMGGMGGMGGQMGGGMMGVPMGVTGPLAHLDLTDDQSQKIVKIQDDLRKSHYDTRGKMMDEQVRLRDLHGADKRDRGAIVAAYKRLCDLRGQLVESSLDAQEKIEAVLTKEQRDMLKKHHPMWMMDGM